MKKHVVSMSMAAALGTLLAAPSVQADSIYFTAVDPCRIVDTRLIGVSPGTPVSQGEVFSFSTNTLVDFAAQGGAGAGTTTPSDCAMPVEAASPNGDPVAVAITITTTGQSGAGHIQVFADVPDAIYPDDLTANLPNASVLNYVTADIANTTTVAQNVDVAQANELSIYASQTAHVIVDVVGYYTASPIVAP